MISGSPPTPIAPSIGDVPARRAQITVSVSVPVGAVVVETSVLPIAIGTVRVIAPVAIPRALDGRGCARPDGKVKRDRATRSRLCLVCVAGTDNKNSNQDRANNAEQSFHNPPNSPNPSQSGRNTALRTVGTGVRSASRAGRGGSMQGITFKCRPFAEGGWFALAGTTVKPCYRLGLLGRRQLIRYGQ